MSASIHQPSRTDAEVELDRLWHVAAFCTDAEVAVRHWQRFTEATRAMKAPASGGLAAAGASLAGSGGSGVPAQLEAMVTQ